jgi:hypothetical protein
LLHLLRHIDGLDLRLQLLLFGGHASSRDRATKRCR